jgi:hypothetical protein
MRHLLHAVGRTVGNRIESWEPGLGAVEEQATPTPEKEKAHMRSPKLTSAILAAAALLVLATAGTAAARVHTHINHRHASGVAGCKISLQVAPRLITSGESVLASGQATACTPAEGQTVTIYQRPAGSPGYSVAGTTTTGKQGVYQVPLGPLTNNSVFYAAVGTAASGHRQVKVAAQVTLVGPPEGKSLFEGIKTGRSNAVTFSGAVSPNDAGAIVVLQRQNAVRGNEWGWIARTIVDAEGHFSITHVFRVPGASSVRVVVRSNHRNVTSPSNVLSYNISQAQNPSLTIESATNPVPFGGSTVIAGTVPGAPNTTLTLQDHAAHGKFAGVATTTTDPEGKYTFPSQSPATSMFYRVQGAGRTSAVLYQGVKYVLTATPLATSVPSGSPVTFTGTVTPASAGHTIYIEKQNITGTGFHVVAVGTVAAGGTYSVSRTFFAPGTDVLRVKIPGDPEHGGTASAPVTVTVTPLPSAKIPPEAPSNGTLPPEGKV